MLDIDNLDISTYDFHCHLDLYPSPIEIIRECEEKKIFTLTVTTTPKAWKQNLEWTQNLKYVRPAIGLHPELVGSRYAELEELESLVNESFFIGEIGLDGSHHCKNSLDKQKVVFERVIDLTSNGRKKILTVHSRKAVNEVIKVIRNYNHTKSKYILHWFTGTPSQAKQALDLGCYFSINHKMLNTKNGMELLKVIPIERVLTETDGPFTSNKQELIKPSDTLETLYEIASIKGINREKMLLNIHNNVKELLK